MRDGMGDDTTVVEIQRQLERVEADLVDLTKRTTLKEILKAVDSSCLSVNNLRAFLQILSIIITILVAGTIGFGYVSLSGTARIADAAQNSERILAHITEVASQIDARVQSVDKAIPDLQQRTDAEIEKLGTEVDARIETVDTRLRQMVSQVEEISELFNRVGVSNSASLNPREQQLLNLLAKEIAPTDPRFNFNAAHLALQFGRYDEALEHLQLVLDSKGIPDDLHAEAASLLSKAHQLKDNPRKLEYIHPQGVRIGQYGPIEFSVNILQILVRNGYLTLQQAQEVIDASRYEQ